MFEDAVAIVTGGESGIGAACVKALAEAGARVVATFFKDQAAADNVRDAAGGPDRVSSIQADVGDEAAVEALFTYAEATFGTATLLVNSAGLNMTNVRLVDMPLAQFERVVRADLTGAFLTCRRMVRALEGKGLRGRIVNISSIHEHAPRPGGVDYDAAKGGLSQLTATLALELAPKGIAVNGVAPGMILTAMNQSALDNPAELKTKEVAIPWGRAGKPDEVATLVNFLLSPAADYITRYDGDDRRGAVAHGRAGRLTVVTFAVEAIDAVTIDAGSPLADMDLMSPFVWKEGDTYRAMIRGVPDPLKPVDPTGIIATGTSLDGLAFTIDPTLAITPDRFPTADDAGGCEDPTVLVTAGGEYLVYYTGVDAARSQGCMLLAKGRELTDLTADRVVLKAPPGEGNIKEATLAQTASGDWRLFYEYAAVGASRIGMASGPSPEGPWTVLDDPFTVRTDSWDDWHLSTGPILTPPGGGDPVMFYNGATADARWRIGWVSFNSAFDRVTGRGLEPILLPPPAKDRAATDIAFAASTIVEGDMIALYYSLDDRILRRAMVRRYG